ncbi:hypothetical protein PAP_04945 [Palaeococcus pacificus DY20341]|uniref:HEPN domain-containing protein n=2 Tax=Palaeococcus TaxID=83867 RepID=A0A075LRM4_9EURY|nr:hypothetical protein PAP_04945 [Palaeococcus pacificus DY20341]
MEDEMLIKIRQSLKLGEESFETENYQLAFIHYLNALLSVGSYLIYRDLGILLPPEGALGMLKVRYPDIYDVILKYQKYQLSIGSVDEELTREIKEETLKIYERDVNP